MPVKAFLQELVEKLGKEGTPWDKMTLVFPNRRAALYFKKYLTSALSQPSFAPRLLTIEEFIHQFSSLRVPDKLELIYRLYQQYQQVMPKAFSQGKEEVEPFDRFYFWGEMLLRDFEEVDKYLVEAQHLFKDLSRQKELDSSFDFLTEEQREFLRRFWFGFSENLTESKQKFLEVWRRLFSLYEAYKSSLLSSGLAYEGMLHRSVVESLHQNTPVAAQGKLHFVGFNALTMAEEKILSWFVENQQAKIHWDADQYYVNDQQQEAGSFLRLYQQHSTLRKTFEPFPSHLRSHKNARVIGAAQAMGQAKMLAQMLEQHLKDGARPEDTLVVLPDEKMLMPVLHGISQTVEKLNVTMGFSLAQTPVFNLVELMVELQMNARDNHFHHKQVLALLGHPYVVAADPAAANAKRKEILAHNWVMIPQNFLSTQLALHRMLFSQAEDVLNYVRLILQEVGSLEMTAPLDQEYIFQFLKLINRMDEVTSELIQLGTIRDRARSFLRLFRQLVRSQKIPFSGEPLRGLQIMGVLETRNLDFKHVFVMSLNEGAFPSFGGKGSYVPFNLRKAYGLPTIEHQDAIYSYLFYRVLQRADNIYLFYNSETDLLGQGEMSRYLQQLIFERPFELTREVLHNPVQPRPIQPIVITKDESVLERLRQLNENTSRFRGISPSALTTYLECRLKFYFKHVASIKEPKEVEEDMDARVLGNFVHDVMEKFYKQLREQKKTKRVESGDFVNADQVIEKLIDQEFIEKYRLDPSQKVIYEGQRVVVKEIVKRFVTKILTLDEQYAPFVMEAIEQQGLLYIVKISHAPGFVVLSGKIDRIDRKENVLRIIDYKTGKDDTDFKSIESLFERTESRNKAAFQTLLYALLYYNNIKPDADVRVVPGLFNRNSLFSEKSLFGFKLDKELIENAIPLFPEFEARLRETLEELYDPSTPFDQTPFPEQCRVCPYQQICYRA